MAVIETKFGVGDVVWYASITTETRQHPCPDCLGSGEWEAKSPAGGTFKFSCPRCSRSYQGNSDMNLRYAQWVPTAERRTIGQVRACAGPDSKNEYMCHETGVGSGSLYYENRIFASKDEALAVARLMAAENNANAEGWVAKQYNATLELCDYQLKDAQMEGAVAAARQSQSRVGYLIEDLREAETIAEVRERIEAWEADR